MDVYVVLLQDRHLLATYEEITLQMLKDYFPNPMSQLWKVNDNVWKEGAEFGVDPSCIRRVGTQIV